jgi:hypothetical protein
VTRDTGVRRLSARRFRSPFWNPPFGLWPPRSGRSRRAEFGQLRTTAGDCFQACSHSRHRSAVTHQKRKQPSARTCQGQRPSCRLAESRRAA